jgi:hypothetical protein
MCLKIFLYEQTICKRLIVALIPMFEIFTQEELTIFG